MRGLTPSMKLNEQAAKAEAADTESLQKAIVE